MAEFICSRCGKHAQTEQTYKRHGRYCRTKTKTPVSRRKSCQSCVKAKARCDPEGKGCTRCRTKNLSCEFDTPNPSSIDSGQSIQEIITPGQKDDVVLDMVDGWGGVQDPYVLPDYSISSANGSMDPFGFFGAFPVDFRPIPDSVQDSLNIMSNLDTQGVTETKQLFEPRDLGPQSQFSVAMTTGILQSYPGLMRERRTFPPFIHHKAYGSLDDDWKLPVALGNAMSIAQMFHNRSSEMESFLWRTIRLEQERIHNEYRALDQFALLAASQALLVYILMRLVDVPEENDNIDEVMLCTFNEVLAHLTSPYECIVRREEFQGNRLPWKEWVFAESVRRTVTIARIIFQFFHVDIHIPYPTLPFFAVAPLPANKLLWRAETEEEWEREWEREVKESPIHGMLRNGDLVRLKNGTAEVNQRKAEWSWWYAGADELGMLVVISASLR